MQCFVILYLKINSLPVSFSLWILFDRTFDFFFNVIVFVLCLGSRPDHSKTGGKKGLKVIQDPHYHRYSNKVDLDSALETFIPVRSDLEH